jgi:hypothetical protein
MQDVLFKKITPRQAAKTPGRVCQERSEDALQMSSIIGALRSVFEYLSLDLLRRVEIRYRLITAFILLSLLPILLSGYLSYVESTAAIREKAEIFSKEVVKQLSKNVLLHMEQVETESSFLVLSDRSSRRADKGRKRQRKGAERGAPGYDPAATGALRID